MWVSPFGNLRVRICASNRSLSQLITSFIGSQCQGIHSMLFLTWPFKSSTLALKSFLFTMLILSVNSGFSQQIDFWNRYPYSCLLPGDRLVLDSLSICLLLVFRYYSVFKVHPRPFRRWWRIRDSNPWPPACKAGALPAELHPHIYFYNDIYFIIYVEECQ